MLSTPTKKSGSASTFEDDPLLAAGQAVRVRLDDHGARLGEGERDHREGDPATRRLTAPSTSGTATATTASERERCAEAPTPTP